MSEQTDDGVAESVNHVGHAEVATLKHLALTGGLDQDVVTTTTELAAQFGNDISAEAVSKRLRRLGDAGLIDRRTEADRQSIRILQDGRQTLAQQYHEYRYIFENPTELTLKGFVTSGMGEGAHYITLPGYNNQFEDRLGYTPYAGTFNVHLTENSVMERPGLAPLASVPIDGWEGEDRTYGPATCYPTDLEVDDERYVGAHALVPERTHHDEEQLELIAPDCLRDVLDVEDGDSLTMRIRGAGE
jgi:riboflavin kinase